MNEFVPPLPRLGGPWGHNPWCHWELGLEAGYGVGMDRWCLGMWDGHAGGDSWDSWVLFQEEGSGG